MKEKEIKRSFWEITKRFFEPIKDNKIMTLKSFIKVSFWGINPISHIYFIQKIVYQIEHKSYENFKIIFIYYIIYILIYEILELIMIKWGWYETVDSYKKSINNKYIYKYITLNNSYLEKVGTGKAISIVDTGIETWGIWLHFFIENIIQIGIALLFSVYIIFSFSRFYGLIFFIIYIVLMFLGNLLNKKMIFYRNQRKDSHNNYRKQFVKIIMSKFEIMQTGKISKETLNLNSYADEMIFYNYKMVPFFHTFFRLPQLTMSLLKIVIIFFVGSSIFSGKVDLSILVSIFGVLTIMDSVINKSVIFFKDFTKEFIHVTKLWDFFDTTPEIQGYNTGADFIYKSGDIKLQNIHFAYNDNKKIFDNFNLDIAGGKITAFVGNSGSGKTTLVKIISQYIKQDSGNVIIDGQDLNEVSLKSYYKNIGYLTQEPSVFDGSILDNLTYALETPPAHSSLPPPLKDTPTDKLRGTEGENSKIHEIIKLSKCEFIYDFPKGLETEIGERGVRLSGGQRQRLAIAKIMLKDPKIIILDEPTSALDSFSEELITKAMNNLFAGRTVLVIAHRLQTVKHADEIIVIENGQIEERGNHGELVTKNGIYNRMLELQSGF